MKSQESRSTQIGQYIREIMNKEHPETVERLVRLVQQKHTLSEQEIIDIACHTGVRFMKKSQPSLDLKHYMVAKNARWYWSIIIVCMLTAIFVLILPEIFPLVYIRYLLGSALVFWMPGYCVAKSLFSGNQLEKLELIALSWGTSIVLVPIMAFVLHYTPWGIRTTSVTIVILILTFVLSTVAVFREHQRLSR